MVVLLITISVVLWLHDQWQGSPASKNDGRITAATHGERAAGGPQERSSNYEIYRNCRIVQRKSNDGDSFLTALPDGREVILRLYYVDAPESAFRRYENGETNYSRIRQQAAELGGITPEQAVEVGEQAKKFSLQLLENKPFTIHTAWDSPYNDQRYHAFIEVIANGKPRWLHELLIEQGLARIKTKPADLPDGTSVPKHLDLLRFRQEAAKADRKGVWKF